MLFHVLIMIHNLIVFQFWKELFPLFHYFYLHCWSRYSYVSILFFKFKILTINFCQKSEKSHDYYSCLPPIVSRVKIKVKIRLKSSSYYPLFQRVFPRYSKGFFPIFFLFTESVRIRCLISMGFLMLGRSTPISSIDFVPSRVWSPLYPLTYVFWP